MHIQNNYPLAQLTSFGTGGDADRLITVTDAIDFNTLISKLTEPTWFLGHGCNVLISDEGLPGTTVLLRHKSLELSKNREITVDSGADWDEFVKFAISHGLWGVELMSGIPSSVGGAIRGNIAAYGQAVSDTLVYVDVIDIRDGSIMRLKNTDLHFKYRSSMLQTKPYLLIMNACFQLQPTKTQEVSYESLLVVSKELGVSTDTLTDRRNVVYEARRRAGSLLETGSKTAGSFFKNPIVTKEQADFIVSFDETGKTADQITKMNAIHGGNNLRVSAAHVLLASGFLRGQCFGNVRLHPEHVLKLENYNHATSKDIYSVAMHIIDTVKQKTGILLESEIVFLGEF